MIFTIMTKSNRPFYKVIINPIVFPLSPRLILTLNKFNEKIDLNFIDLDTEIISNKSSNLETNYLIHKSLNLINMIEDE
ncbi:hypothetical protein BpHYR1_026539 [Brachionus plicatilis]|uniref:Uncharacterized protein n=1 Tax=Brachionus plicatilis TaxID=10195 RepID=A0A3M7P851_BRAPC|nr:hypothetical protein BpHYR1_026539 [Brachionus plicatilis]